MLLLGRQALGASCSGRGWESLGKREAYDDLPSHSWHMRSKGHGAAAPQPVPHDSVSGSTPVSATVWFWIGPSLPDMPTDARGLGGAGPELAERA